MYVRSGNYIFRQLSVKMGYYLFNLVNICLTGKYVKYLDILRNSVRHRPDGIGRPEHISNTMLNLSSNTMAY